MSSISASMSPSFLSLQVYSTQVKHFKLFLSSPIFFQGQLKAYTTRFDGILGLKHPMWNANLTQPVHGSRAYSDVRRWHGYCTLYQQFPHNYCTQLMKTFQDSQGENMARYPHVILFKHYLHVTYTPQPFAMPKTIRKLVNNGSFCLFCLSVV